MPGVTKSEIVGCDNPLLQFFYQEKGRLTDITDLEFEIVDVTSKSSIFSSGALDVADCPTGVKLGLGRYAALIVDTSGYDVGTHRITWTYKVTPTGPERKWSQIFEVLDSVAFPTGAGFRTYVTSASMLAANAFAGCDASSLQRAGLEIAEQIEALTGRFFEPRYVEMKLNGTDASALVMQEPIIGISEVSVLSGDVASGDLPIDLTGLRVYNRHLQGVSGSIGMVDHDDRDNPRIEFATDLPPGAGSITQAHFHRGRLNIQVNGVFGFTEPDGTPVGRSPLRLERAAGILTLRKILDPFGLDVSVSQPGRLREAKTRDQQIKFGGAADGVIGPLTGDRIVDDILMAYLRPPHYGAVGSTARTRSMVGAP